MPRDTEPTPSSVRDQIKLLSPDDRKELLKMLAEEPDGLSGWEVWLQADVEKIFEELCATANRSLAIGEKAIRLATEEAMKLIARKKCSEVKRNRTAELVKRIDAAINAGNKSPRDIFNSVKINDADLLLRRIPGKKGHGENRLIDPESMMRTYRRAKKQSDNCN